MGHSASRYPESPLIRMSVTSNYGKAQSLEAVVCATATSQNRKTNQYLIRCFANLADSSPVSRISAKVIFCGRLGAAIKVEVPVSTYWICTH
jgi:hypothetical protein